MKFVSFFYPKIMIIYHCKCKFNERRSQLLSELNNSFVDKPQKVQMNELWCKETIRNCLIIRKTGDNREVKCHLKTVAGTAVTQTIELSSLLNYSAKKKERNIKHSYTLFCHVVKHHQTLETWWWEHQDIKLLLCILYVSNHWGKNK